MLTAGDRASGTRWGITLGLVGMIVAVCLFWTASNYAVVLGTSLADRFSDDLQRAIAVVAYSERRLYIDAPGVVETPLPDADEAAYRYRHAGLRLLEHTGGTFFLVSTDGRRPMASLSPCPTMTTRSALSSCGTGGRGAPPRRRARLELAKALPARLDRGGRA